MKMDDHNEWTKPENPEVEAGKDAFAEAQQAEALREKISQYAATAVQYGPVDRGWVNAQLAQLGAHPVEGTAQYKINVPIDGSYGTTVTANSRAEALEKFNQYAAKVAEAGQLTTGHHCQGVYGITLTGGAPVFFSGPQDPEEYDGPVPGLDALKVGIRQMLKEAVTAQGWGHSYAQAQLGSMGLEPLPALVHRAVSVPVSGVAQVVVSAFEGDDDEAGQRTAETVVARSKKIMLTPEEVGTAFMPRSGSMSMELVDDDGDPDEDD